MLLTIRKYVCWNLIVTLALCIVLLLGLTVMLDFVQRADDFSKFVSETGRGWTFVLNFYLFRLPMFASWLFPIILLTATGVSLIQMNKNNELIPLLMAGISIHQILLPLYLMLIAGGIGVFSVQEWVLPSLAPRIARTKQLLDSRAGMENILVVDEQDTYLHGQSYHPDDRTLSGVTLMQFKNNVLRKIVRADSARWQQKPGGTWILRNGRVSTYDEEGFRAEAPVTFGENGFEWKTTITPHQILTMDADIKFHSLQTLNEMIDEWPHLITLRITRQTRLVYPFIAILLPLFALPILLQREMTSYFKGGLVIAGIAIGFYLVQVIFMKLGTSGILHPIPATWTPFLLGTCLFLYLKDRIIT